MANLVGQAICGWNSGSAGSGRGHRIWRWLVEGRRRSRDRVALLQLDERLLRDIGISRDAALREAEKPFWR